MYESLKSTHCIPFSFLVACEKIYLAVAVKTDEYGVCVSALEMAG